MDPNDVTYVNYPKKPRESQCEARDSISILEKLIYLIEEPMADDCVHRHLLLFDDFFATYTTDFWMKDMPLIMKLLELVVQRLISYPQYQIPLEKLLEKARTPPLLMQSSELLNCKRDVCEYFTLLGFILLDLKSEENLKNILEIILKLLNENPKKDSLNRVPLKAIHEGVTASLLPEVISQMYGTAEGDCYKLLLKVGIALALISPIICGKMISESVINYLVWRLDPNCKKRKYRLFEPKVPTADKIYNLGDTVKLTWYLLQGIEDHPNHAKFQSMNMAEWAWLSFRYAFRILIKDKRAKLDRNILTACLLKALKLFSKVNFYITNLPDDICLVCTQTHFEVGDTWSTEIRHSKEILDYKFKKMLLLLVGFCAKHDILEPIKRHKVMTTLFRIIAPDSNEHWSFLQFTKIIHLALCTCTILVNKMMDEFLNCGGPERIMSTTKYYLENEYVVKVLMSCLHLVWKSLDTENKTVLEKFKENDTTTTLLALCKIILSKPKLTLMKQNCLCYCFMIMEIFSKEYIETDREGIDFGLKYLNKVLNPRPVDAFLDAKLTICCISYLWQCIKLNDDNLKHFVSSKGVYLLLDIIEKSSSAVQVIGLGMLVDLCEEGSCVPYLFTWRKNGKRYTTLLFDIVRAENKSNEVKLEKYGVIGDIYKPLMGKKQSQEMENPNRKFDSCPSIMDMYGSSRPKVYAIIQLVKRHQDVVDFVNEEYKIQVFEASIRDQITMLVMENFFALKIGEVWTEVASDLKRMGLKLTGIDTNLLSILTLRLPRWALHIKKSQITLINKQRGKEIAKEDTFYNKLKETRLPDSLQAMHELDYIARTTENIFRLTKKMKQREEIAQSRIEAEINTEFHSTYLDDINVNPVFNQKVTVYSSVIKSQSQDIIIPVSPSTSNDDQPPPENCPRTTLSDIE